MLRPLRMFLPDSLPGQFSGEEAHFQRQEQALLSGHGLLNLELDGSRRGASIGDGHIEMLALPGNR